MSTKKLGTFIVSFVLIFSFAVPSFAQENNNIFPANDDSFTNKVSQFLDTSSTTQILIANEKDCIDMLLKEEVITRTDLNEQLEALSIKPESELRQFGYNENQIKIIHGYKKGEDAYDHIFESQNNLTTMRSNATLRFRYGLAGHSARRSVTIAYDMNWSSVPFWTFTDCFGIGWIVADADSKNLSMKIDNAIAQADYYDNDTNQSAHIYEDVPINDFSNSVILGYPDMAKSDNDRNIVYPKHISGVTSISTQSNSNNIDTVQLFVAYGHTTLAIGIDVDVSLGFDISKFNISFVPNAKVHQEIIAQDNRTFNYDDTISVDA